MTLEVKSSGAIDDGKEKIQDKEESLLTNNDSFFLENS